MQNCLATRSFFACFLALLAAGCASRPVQNPPLSPELRAGLGRIAIVSHTGPDTFAYELPNLHVRREALTKAIGASSTVVGATAGVGALGYGMAVGAGQGGYTPGYDDWSASFVGASMVGGALGAATGVLLAPVGVTVGTLHDAILNETPGNVRAATPAVVQTLRVVHFEQELQQRLQAAIQAQTTCQATQATIPVLDPVKEMPTLQNRYRTLRAQGFDMVIDMSASGEFNAKVGWHNPFALKATTWFSVVDLRNCSEIYSDQLQHHSKSRKFVSWAKDDGKLLKEELESCFKEFTERMMAQVFADAP